MIRVQTWGVAGSIRDGGRPGRAALGAPRGGAADAWSLRLANRLVGNGESDAGIESSGGLEVEVVDVAVLVAVTGAQADMSVRDGPPLAWGSPTVLPAGARLRIGRLRDGARTYLAVRGALASHSTDGGTDGESTLVVGRDPATPTATQQAVPLPSPDRLTIWPGPRRDWFDESAWLALCSGEFRVAASSDRVGVRLAGARLARRTDGELASEGIVEGAIQVPPDGDPIVMLADHPTTGGYPVIAVVDPAHLRHVAQLAAGHTIRFRAAPDAPDRAVGRRAQR